LSTGWYSRRSFGIFAQQSKLSQAATERNNFRKKKKGKLLQTWVSEKKPCSDRMEQNGFVFMKIV